MVSSCPGPSLGPAAIPAALGPVLLTSTGAVCNAQQEPAALREEPGRKVHPTQFVPSHCHRRAPAHCGWVPVPGACRDSGFGVRLHRHFHCPVGCGCEGSVGQGARRDAQLCARVRGSGGVPSLLLLGTPHCTPARGEGGKESGTAALWAL